MQELEEAKADGALSDFQLCLSREPGVPKCYVQDGVAMHAARIAEILKHPDAHYYVCGDATMAGVVALALQKAVGLETCAAMQV